MKQQKKRNKKGKGIEEILVITAGGVQFTREIKIKLGLNKKKKACKFHIN